MADSYVLRFLFEDLDIRGAFVRLGTAWQAMQDGRAYPAPVTRLLGEMTATAAIIGGNLKQPGRLSFQLSGHGPLKSLILDCTQDLKIRGMARFEPGLAEAPLPQLIGDGRLLLTLDTPLAQLPYQSFVPLEGNSIAEIFELYLAQSEQQPARLFLAADGKAAAGLFLQKLPDADLRDADGWNRIAQLAATVKPEELLTLRPEALLTRLFAEEDKRLFEAREVVYHCPEDWDKVRGMVLQLGRGEVEAILAEHGEVLVRDDICNRDYRFSAADIAELFDGATPEKPTLH
ncbi:Hsp33 family molecular chaperone HslO [Azospira restricta]|uniref:Hsp33 family molecular chaperone HslO n=2 Tax=Azospira restricta TaxID=404405 RepID=A0A974Y5Z6_9RHOO|nr:Hsp33 family molecular chaperone HslO [Azospira restricta]